VTLVDELNAILAADLPEQDDPGKLATVLYNRCYTASILDPPLSPLTTSGPDDLTPLLAAANQSRAAWDEGWRIDQLLDGGRILARKGGAARAFLPGEYLTYRGVGSGPEAGAMVSVFIPPGSADLQPAYYHAFSETVGEFEEDEQTVRFFWNVSAEGAPHLMETITRELNRFQIPFRFKCVNRTSDYPRRDAGVLYLHRRYYPITALVTESIYPRLAPWLYPGTPLFAKRLEEGLAFAEDPGESFGENRSKILAAGMVASRGKPMEERIAEVRRQFESRGLSLDRPWLNAGSVDQYEFPFPAS
jgi:hypothetical protein